MADNKNVRLIDIANELGYTVNTVSRALRDKSDIGESTKKKVKEVAKSMGYIPNSIASSLRNGNTKTIAIVFDNMVNPYFMIMADKLHNRLETLGYATMIFAARHNVFTIGSLKPIIYRKVDGIITFLEPDQKVIEICEKNKIPIVLIGRKNAKLKIDSVSTDDIVGGYEVGKLLAERGAQNIGYIGAPQEIECSVRRLNGLKMSLDDLKIPYDEKNMRYMSNRPLSDELNVLLRNNVDAIFFFNDVMALEGITILQKFNNRVPEDIKIVGFDNIQEEFFIPVELTTIASDKDKIVSSAIDILLYKINNKADYHKIRNVDYEIFVKLGMTT